MNFVKIISERAMYLPKTSRRDTVIVTANSFSEAIEKLNASVGVLEKKETLEIIENFKKTEETEKWSSRFAAVEIRKNPFNLVRIDFSHSDGRILSIDIEAFRPLKSYDDPIKNFLERFL